VNELSIIAILLKKDDSFMMANAKVVKRFWQLFDAAEFEEAGDLISPNAIIRWWNTREEFKNKEKFIEANRIYPGRWRISIERLECFNNLVITVVNVAEKDISFYATSFFTLEEERIIRIDEYWGENTEPPEWRVKASLSEIFL
jgi:hypothetical protein